MSKYFINYQNNIEKVLIEASKYGKINIINQIYNDTTHVSEQCNLKMLMYSSNNNYIDIVKKILEKKIDINLQDINGDTALLWASGIKKRGIYNNIDIINFLLNNKANINLPNKNNDTALIWASKEGNFEIVKTLLENKAHVNHNTNYKYNSLHYAAIYNHLNIINLLLNNKANIYSITRNNKTALMWATKKKHFHICEKILHLHKKQIYEILNNIYNNSIPIVIITIIINFISFK